MESELLDQYVSGRLAPEERKKFGEYLAGLPNGAGKLATAHALMEAARERRKILPRPSAVTASKSRSRWIPSGGQPARGLVWKYAIAAVLIVSFAALGAAQTAECAAAAQQEQIPQSQAELDRAILRASQENIKGPRAGCSEVCSVLRKVKRETAY